MAWVARVTFPGLAHHRPSPQASGVVPKPPGPMGGDYAGQVGLANVTQRGNRRMQTFFGDEDYHVFVAAG